MKSRGIFSAIIIVILFSGWFYANGESQYMAILIDGQKAGYAIHNTTITGQTVQTTDTMMLTINRLGVPVTVSVVESCIETNEGKPLGFEVIQDMSLYRTTMTGTVSSLGECL